MSPTPKRGARTPGGQSDDPAEAQAPEETPKGPRGEAAWQAERRRIADRNAQARKAGMQQRREHETRIAAIRRPLQD